jgi:hypothetical protein
MYVWSGSAWTEISSSADIIAYKYTVAGGATSVSGADDNGLTLSYTVGKEQVYINGVLQVRGSDYTASTGSSITGMAALTANDIVTVLAFTAFSVSNTYTQAEANARFVQNSGDFSAGKNRCLNSDISVWQRGTSFTANSTYGPDRWFLTGVTSQMTFAQVTSSLPSTFQYGIKLQRNSGSTSTDIFSIAQPFETAASIPLQGQTVTLSFWAKAGANFSGAPVGLIRMYSGTGTNQAASSQFGAWTGYSEWQNTSTFAPTSTWTRFTTTGTVPSNATQIGFRLGWSATGTAGADDSLQITGVQFETGSIATAFQTATGNPQAELAACQRYFERYSSESSSNGAAVFGTGWAKSTSKAVFMISSRVQKRVVPTITFSAQGDFRIYDDISSLETTSAITAVAATFMDQQGFGNFMVEATPVNSTLTAFRPMYLIPAGGFGVRSISISAEL